MNNFTDLTFEQMMQLSEQLRDPNMTSFSGIPTYVAMTNSLADYPIYIYGSLERAMLLRQEIAVQMWTNNPHLSLKTYDTKLRNFKLRTYHVCIDEKPVLEFKKLCKLT